MLLLSFCLFMLVLLFRVDYPVVTSNTTVTDVLPCTTVTDLPFNDIAFTATTVTGVRLFVTDPADAAIFAVGTVSNVLLLCSCCPCSAVPVVPAEAVPVVPPEAVPFVPVDAVILFLLKLFILFLLKLFLLFLLKLLFLFLPKLLLISC